jgi:oligoendopeptidase F
VTLTRDSVPVERTWDDTSVYATTVEWEAELDTLLAELSTLTAFQGRLGESPSVLLAALEARDAIDRRLGRVYVYALLGYAVETTDAAAVARFGRAQAAEAQVLAAVSFVEPELLALGADRLAECGADEQALGRYGHYFDDLARRAGHTRSAEVEEVLGLVSDVFSGPPGVYSALVDSDVIFAPALSEDGEPVDVSQGSIEALLASADRTLRRTAWESYADGYLGVRNTLAANLAGTVKQAVFQARVRRHESPLAVALSRSNVPAAVFDNLIATFEANLPTWHRYFGLRRRIHDVEQLAPYDLAAPLGDSSPVLDYEQCVQWVCESLAPLGEEYVDALRRGCIEQRWIDVLPTAGKMGGAFSAGAPGMAPFIVMSFDGTAVSLGTLAHELGHSMHSYLTWQTQPQIYTHYSMFVAESRPTFTR